MAVFLPNTALELILDDGLSAPLQLDGGLGETSPQCLTEALFFVAQRQFAVGAGIVAGAVGRASGVRV
jgi:hypothetical protein